MLSTINKSTKNSIFNTILQSKNNTQNLSSFTSPTKSYFSLSTPAKRNFSSKVTKGFESSVSKSSLKHIDYKPGYHYKPILLQDKIAYSFVKFLRFFADSYFRKNYIRRAICLETVAAVPGMVGGLFRHLYSLRNMEDNGEVIQMLLYEAENERQHLLAFLEVGKPGLVDRLVVKAIQPFFFSFYMIFYGLFPRTAHRFVGYLEEEAIRSYDCFEHEIQKGHIKNVAAPEMAIKYWKLPQHARLIDVVRAVRADEAMHRDANHELADVKPFSLGK